MFLACSFVTIEIRVLLSHDKATGKMASAETKIPNEVSHLAQTRNNITEYELRICVGMCVAYIRRG